MRGASEVFSTHVLTHPQDDGHTALRRACVQNCLYTVIKQLVQKGANVHAKGQHSPMFSRLFLKPYLCLDKSGRTVLHLVCYSGREDVVSLLLAHGADSNLAGEWQQPRVT